MFNKGDKVQDIHTNEVFTVKRSYMQDYAGKPDQTVLLEPTETQPTPWNKGANLMLTATLKPNRISTRDDCCICTINIKRQSHWPANIDQIYVAHWFPVDDSLNADAFGIRVCLWHRKPDFDNISMGESHFDYTVFEYDNQPDGHELFHKNTVKTIGKKWANIAANYYGLMN